MRVDWLGRLGGIVEYKGKYTYPIYPCILLLHVYVVPVRGFARLFYA